MESPFRPPADPLTQHIPLDAAGSIKEVPVDWDGLVLICWLLRNHVRYKVDIRKKLNAGFSDSYKIYDWLNEKMLGEDLMKIHRRMRREMESNEDAFANQQRMWFVNLPVETQHAIARIAAHKSHGTSMDAPKINIITATR